MTGIFGLAAYSLSMRKRELGIRMALGAQRALSVNPLMLLREE